MKSLTLCMKSKFSYLCCRLLFSKLTFITIFFQEHSQSVNSLDSDQNRQNGGPDLGPNCLQSLSLDDKSRARKEFNFDFTACLCPKKVIIFIPVNLKVCFGRSKEPSH